ncbi:hypothetical protein GGR58DRAFT_522111 [Xylaria digitata]|nr:hypothetical protein GGR58DRAFT_522111 [Xylaria digitata]
MELAGAPPSNEVLPGREMPVMESTLRALSSAKFDCGDLQVAWHNIGLASTNQNQNTRKPRRRQLDDYIRRLVWYTTQPPNLPGNRSSEAARKKKMRILFSAIRTIRGYRNSRWDWDDVININRHEDRATNAPNWRQDVPRPLPWPQLRARLTAHNVRLQRRVDTFEPLGNLQLSVGEREANSDAILGQLTRYWDSFSQGGFTAIDGAGTERVFQVLNWPEDGNSLWYCLCHPRHRLYVHLERQSWTEMEQQKPGSERLWGRTSILRALHLNTPDSGPPMYGNFQGMMQVIADYFCKEVILFTRPEDVRIDVLRPQYNYRVFGSRNDGQLNGQLYFVTDAVPEQYQVVTLIDQTPIDYRCRTSPQDPPSPGVFDTSDRSADDRYGWINAPWMPLRPLLGAYEPIPLINPPMLDPLFTIPFNGDECWQFSGRGEAVDSDARYGNGAVPILPDPVTAGWLTETMAPLPGPYPYPEFPYGFGNRNIVTGVYQDASGREWWPQWNNILAYKAHEFRELAVKRDLPTTPHKLSLP